MPLNMSLRMKSMLLTVVFSIVLLGLWELVVQPPESTEPLSEYEMLLGASDQEARVPPPSKVITWHLRSLATPFTMPALTIRVLVFSWVIHSIEY